MELDALLQGRGVSAEAIAEARRRGAASGRSVAAVLVEMGLLGEAEAVQAEAAALGIEFVESIADDQLDPELVARLPVEWARAHCALPIRWRGGLAALIGRVSAAAAAGDLSVLLGCDLPPVCTTEAELNRAIERCYFRRRPAGGAAALEVAVAPAAGGGGSPAAEDLLRIADGAPVTQYVNYLLLEALRAGASDVHIEPGEERVRIRFRVDGLLREQPSPPAGMAAALISRLKVMARMDIAERRLPQDGMARVQVGTREIDIRVSSVPIADGERLVLRLLNRDAALLPLSELGIAPADLAAFRRLLSEPQGLVLVTGPTGSGKTTTLYAALQELDTRRLNVLTIEDPIEYRLDSISQIQVHPRIGLTFARLLRHVLRQDPDVVLVGETRDLETAEIAVRASLTGHLVFTTLHTNDAVSAAMRLADMGVEPYLLAASLKGVLAQRLVRRLCPSCRRPATIGAADIEEWGAQIEGALPAGRHWTAVGCDRCDEGYRGRVGVFELLRTTPALLDALRRRAPPAELRAVAVASGMRPLREAGLALVAEGRTSLAELRRVLGHDDGA
ncbi:MAG: GspE/PulE family protein [Kiritimatiellae bacterium]|nr:GspE/PulE family protein [Kiritimatiellia bacterium]